MKKILKLLIISALIASTALCMTACGKEKVPVSNDVTMREGGIISDKSPLGVWGEITRLTSSEIDVRVGNETYTFRQSKELKQQIEILNKDKIAIYKGQYVNIYYIIENQLNKAYKIEYIKAN